MSRGDGSGEGTARERELKLPHFVVAARAWGEGRPVIALHGWLDNAATFDTLAPQLRGVELVALDLPGHGRSDHLPAGCGHHFVDWVPIVIDAADALGWKRFSLIGHSMGAGISSLVPAAVPGRVERMVLLEGFGPLSDPPGDAPASLATALQQEFQLADKEPTVFGSIDEAVAARRRSSDLDAEAAGRLVDRGTLNVSGGVRFTFDPRLRTRSRTRLTEEQVIAFFESIDCPVLAVRATEGWPFPADLVAGRLAAVRNLEVAEVEGGHHVHLTHPERVAPIVNRFLR